MSLIEDEIRSIIRHEVRSLIREELAKILNGSENSYWGDIPALEGTLEAAMAKFVSDIARNEGNRAANKLEDSLKPPRTGCS